MPFPFNIDHCAATGKLRCSQLRIDRLQIGVAAGSVDDRRKLRMQGHGMIRGIERKIRYIRGSLHFYPIKAASEVSHGMQHAPNPLDSVQVSMLEDVLPGHRRIARRLGIPGAKRAHRVNIPFWHRIGQGGVIRGRRLRPHVAQHNVLQLKNFWILVRLVGANHESRIVEDDLVHDNLDLAVAPRMTRALLPNGLRRDMDSQPLHMR